jgi:NAD(P)-dependent dehydrogenase (short-subunit alcohol dehydrogenase family)
MKLQFDFTNKRALIVGAGHPIGRAVAHKLMNHGARVAVHDSATAAPGGESLPDDANSAATRVKGDVRDVVECRRIVESAIAQLGGLDLLVFCPGSAPDALIEDATEDLWEQTFSATIKAAFFCSQAAFPALKGSKGLIVNVASILGLMAGPPGKAIYSAAIACVIHQTRMLALRFAPDAVRVNCLCHGALVEEATTNASGRAIPADIPLGRRGSADEMAAAVIFLASQHTRFMTGSTLVSDGGTYSGH